MSEGKNINDPFERLFRQKADEYEIMYNEADWEKLEKNLDAMDRKRAMARKRYFAAAAILLLFALFGYFTYQNYMKINRLEQQLNDQTAQQLQRNTDSNLNSERPAENPLAATERFEESLAENKSETALTEENNSTTLQNETASYSDLTKSNDEFLASSIEAENLIVQEIPSHLSRISTPDDLEPNTVDFAMLEVPKPENDRLFAARQEQSPGKTANPRKVDDTFSRFAIGFALAPDFSTAGSLSDFYSPGYKIGASVEYNFNENFGISAGVIHSTVRYTAGPNEYRAPGGYWTNGITPTETLAECVILDIPINLKYNFLDFGRSRLFTTAGVSTYIMLNEVYEFNYYENEPNLAQSWSAKTGTRHWASNAGFSIGFEYDLNPTLSIRAEPFIKIPLREVGWGNVNLYSTGSFISLHYHFK